MIIYWILFLYPCLVALSPLKINNQIRQLNFLTFSLFSILVIGFRYEVGGDWESYLKMLDATIDISLVEAMALNDPGYMVLNWLSSRLGFGIVGVNLVCGTLFMNGLVRLCLKQPFPWIGLAVAVPYLLTVVVMGYSRQAVAIGFVLWAFSKWQTGHFYRCSLLVVAGALFHKSAVVVLPFMFFMSCQSIGQSLLRFVVVVPVLFIVAVSLVVPSFGHIWIMYVERSQLHSAGAMIRVLMNAFPALLVLIGHKYFKQYRDYRLLVLLAMTSIASVPLVTQISTAVDRLALYLLPIQIMVLPRILRNPNTRAFYAINGLIFYGVVLFVWLTFASHKEFWVPYRWSFFQ